MPRKMTLTFEHESKKRRRLLAHTGSEVESFSHWSLTMAEPIISISRAAREVGLAYHVLIRLVHLRRVPSVRVDGVRRVRLSQVRAVIEEIPVKAA